MKVDVRNEVSSTHKKFKVPEVPSCGNNFKN
jgi:hypothetical protein